MPIHVDGVSQILTTVSVQRVQDVGSRTHWLVLCGRYEDDTDISELQLRRLSQLIDMTSVLVKDQSLSLSHQRSLAECNGMLKIACPNECTKQTGKAWIKS